MSDEGGISRRRLLKGLTATGALGAVGGAATRAYMFDEESLPTREMIAGEVDLELAWEARSGAERMEDPDQGGDPFPTNFGNGSHAAIPFQDIQPDNQGYVTFAYRNCHNPAKVWLRATADGSSLLAEELDVKLWHDENCDNTINTELDEDIVLDGRLDELLEGSLGSGLLLDLDQCQFMAKIEVDDDGYDFVIDEGSGTVTSTDPPTFELSDSNTTLEIELTEIYMEGDEIVGFDFEVLDGPSICEVVTKGGNETRSYSLDCERADKTIFAPKNETNDNREHYGLSHFSFHYCGPCSGCEPTCIGFRWELSEDAPSDVTSTSLELEFDFRAQQCRHEDNTTNPWT